MLETRNRCGKRLLKEIQHYCQTKNLENGPFLFNDSFKLSKFLGFPDGDEKIKCHFNELHVIRAHCSPWSICRPN